MLFKTRLVALGNLQNEMQYNSHDISSLVMTSTTMRALFAKAASEKWKIAHLDICSAFLNAKLKETIYTKLPAEVSTECQLPEIVLLKRSIYGLKQSPKA